MMYTRVVKDPKKLRKAAEQITAILDDHFASLPPAQRAAKTRAFEKVVAKVGGSRAKSAESSGPRESQRRSQRPELRP